MKKKVVLSVILIFAAIGVMVFIFSNKGGNVRNVKTSFTSTEHHSEKEIKTCNCSLIQF